MTYKQAYDKIIDAYFRDEIKPYNAGFCFCGTLCDNNHGWNKCSYSAVYKNQPHHDFMNYSGKNYADMERELLRRLDVITSDHFDYESELFAGMSAALDVLKQIHIDRGEVIDELPAFTKRELVTSK